MSAVIIEVHRSMQIAAERCLPPDHRVRAERPSEICPDLVDLYIEGPTILQLPGQPVLHADLSLVLVPVGEEQVRLEGRWRYWRRMADIRLPVAGSEPWVVGTWDSFDAMMDEVMRGCDARPALTPVG